MASAASLRSGKDSGRHHGLAITQRFPTAIEPAVQDPFFTQVQFDKGITAMLAIAGFDGVTASALHSFKALAEEYIVSFLETVGISMLASRRNTPIPQDFAFALAKLGISPAQLEEQIKIRIPEDLAAPSILEPAPQEAPPTDLSNILGPVLVETTHRNHPQIPLHFPPLPSRHTWKATKSLAERETDARKIRELAAQEGIVAERALRGLAAAANQPRSKLQKTASAAEQRKQAIWKDAEAALNEDLQDAQGDIDMDGSNDEQGRGVKGRPDMVINYDRAYWRKGASFGTMRD